jgi:methionine synthase II (cobalamin-independent)
MQNRERCIGDLVSTGIDFPSYPQLAEMGAQFLDDLVEQDCGIARENGGYMLREKEIKVPTSPPGLEPYRWTVEHLENKGMLQKIKLKSSVTGPFTLASYIKTRGGTFPFNTAISDIGIVKQLADILSDSCRAFTENSHVISIDEPILSVVIGRRILFEYGEEDIIEIYNKLKTSCGNRLVGTHICGTITPLLAKILLQTELDFLNHEFHDTPKNFELYDPKDVEKSDKTMSIGCVSSRNPKIETVEEILDVMARSKKYGENLIFTPDCGFRPLRVNSGERGYRIAMEKLRNLVEAADKIRSERA